jgi:hypothetical protein
VVEGTWLKASSANDELKIGSLGGGGGGDVNLSQGDISCGPAKCFWANNGVVLGHHLALSHISL